MWQAGGNGAVAATISFGQGKVSCHHHHSGGHLGVGGTGTGQGVKDRSVTPLLLPPPLWWPFIFLPGQVGGARTGQPPSLPPLLPPPLPLQQSLFVFGFLPGTGRGARATAPTAPAAAPTAIVVAIFDCFFLLGTCWGPLPGPPGPGPRL